MALRVWRPTKPSMAPELNPAAFSLPCSSRISSGVRGAELGSAVDGNCDADWGKPGVDLISSFAVSGAGTDGRTVTSRLPAAGTSAFACSIRFDGNGVEA